MLPRPPQEAGVAAASGALKEAPSQPGEGSASIQDNVSTIPTTKKNPRGRGRARVASIADLFGIPKVSESSRASSLSRKPPTIISEADSMMSFFNESNATIEFDAFAEGVFQEIAHPRNVKVSQAQSAA